MYMDLCMCYSLNVTYMSSLLMCSAIITQEYKLTYTICLSVQDKFIFIDHKWHSYHVLHVLVPLLLFIWLYKYHPAFILHAAVAHGQQE